MIWIIILIIVVIILKLAGLKLNVDFKSFFKKGFKKVDSAFGLYLYTGKQGTGKTYSAVRFTESQRLIQKTPEVEIIVLTNIKSYSTRCDCIYMADFMYIINFIIQKSEDPKYKFIILYDEIFSVIEKAGALKKDFLTFLSQLRKRGIIMVSTAQYWAEINITLRRYCRFQIDCSMISIPFLKKALCINLINDGDAIRWDNDIQDFIAPLIQTNVFKGNKEIIDKYDTYETISSATTGLNKRS